MSKRIASAPLSRVERIGIVFGGGRSMSQVKAASGCDWIINGGLCTTPSLCATSRAKRAYCTAAEI